MVDIVLATRNKKKVEEMKTLLADAPVCVHSIDEFPDVPEVEETGSTFVENAELKAKAVAEATGMIAVADDSGLEVDALGGEPGVYSSRYAGPDATDRDKYMLVLERLANTPDELRTARFRAAVSIATPDGKVVTVEGKCEGVIAHDPRGEHGFGYDPIFCVPEFGRNMAELAPEEKNSISHRGRALQKAKRVLVDIIR